MQVQEKIFYDTVYFSTKNQSSREGNLVSLVVFHCIGIPDLAEITHGFQHDQASGGWGVSSHYLIPQLSLKKIHALYPDFLPQPFDSYCFPDQIPVMAFSHNLAQESLYHAGPSVWKGSHLIPGCETSVNKISVGIEFHTPGYANGDGSDWLVFEPYTEEQKKIGLALAQKLKKQFNLPRASFVGHSDICPFRLSPEGDILLGKTDPGIHFPWKWFARNGIGAWYKPVNKASCFVPSVSWFQKKLFDLGYTNTPQNNIPDLATAHTLNAFRMHFMPERWNGYNGLTDMDAELVSILAGDFSAD